ncbi:major facilitator superfamily domain-containing protein [Ilyonectria robusta]|uniref:major facilitator superfamily domain-containing protein n=1 Tax=Ilyonectria robusta TaxID=1079257 RepID=UPI001E8E4DF2|nr:major facilitator superfamily domain-containing protein [Ilyonectria robusta]KAH8665497.1 major facilitator superfamily domain-containing protein [Ilyonectria robusta]
MASNEQNAATTDGIVAITHPDVEMASIPIPQSKNNDDPYLVVFNPEYDAENPKDWPTSRKWAVTDVLSATGFNRIMVSTIMAPALSTIAKELDMNSAESVMALSIYLLATAFGPLVIGPLSEIYGRKRILHISNVWFLVWNIACGFAYTKGLLIAARFLAGFGASSVYALAGGVLGDVWSPEQRGRSLGIYLLIPLLGAAVGPIIGGFMAARTTWRWMFWSTSIFQGVMILVSFTTFRETYAPFILKRRAERLRRETGNQQYQTVQERHHGHKSAMSTLGRALTRPMRLILFHPIIQIISVISAFYYGILYIILSTFSDLWVNRYHQSVEISGLHYLAIALGEVAGSQIGGPLMDYLYRRMQAARDASSRSVELYVPEFRIPLMFPGALMAPLALLLYGWAGQYQLHWLVVDVGIFFVTFGMQIADMPLTAYVMDAYMEHTSSAAAAEQFLRSLTAFLFPLFAPKMYETLGYGWGSSSMALAGLIFGLPAPLILWYYGSKLRAKAQSSY